MSFTRDRRIFGEILQPLIGAFVPEPPNPMQHFNDLQSDLNFAKDQSTDGSIAAVMTTQEAVAGVLDELTTLRAQLAALAKALDGAKRTLHQYVPTSHSIYPIIDAALHAQPKDGR